jgi:hypothetical protein
VGRRGLKPPLPARLSIEIRGEKEKRREKERKMRGRRRRRIWRKGNEPL